MKDERPATIQDGVLAAREGEYLRALTTFEQAFAVNGKIPNESKSAEGISFYGLCLGLVEKKYKQAIDLCRKAIELEFYSADHYVNLARVYLAAGNRKKAVETVEQGLKVLAEDEVLTLLRKEMGQRARPAVPFLSRENPINKALGRTRHAKKVSVPPKKGSS